MSTERLDLEYMAMWWLRFEKRCPVALTERTPRPMAGRPDVLGVTKAGYILEIEIKRSLLDFRANARKHHIRNREDIIKKGSFGNSPWYSLKTFPRQFWFLVPSSLVEVVQPELPKWAGLLTDHDRRLKCIAKAPVNEEATKLPPKGMIKLGNCMANQIWSQASVIHSYWSAKNNPEYVPDCMALLI